MDENRTHSEIIRLINKNKCITESNSSTDDDTNKWEVVNSRRNKTNKNNGDSESVGVMNLNIIGILVMILLILE